MTSANTFCPACDTPTPNGILCDAGTEQLAGLLYDVPWLLDQLDVATSRQTKLGAAPSSARSAEQSLPVDLTAASTARALAGTVTVLAAALGAHRLPDLLQDARAALHTARAAVADARAADPPDPVRVDRAEAVRGEWEQLLAQIGNEMTLLAAGARGAATWIRIHRLAQARALPDIAAHLHRLDRTARPPAENAGVIDRGGSAWRAIDHPVELIPLGECRAETIRTSAQPCACSCHTGGAYRPTCDLPGGCGSTGCSLGVRSTVTVTPCPARVYAEPGQSVALCPACRTPHDVRRRRDAALNDYEYIQGRPSFLAGIMTAVGLHCSAAAIRGYAHRKRIEHTWKDPASGETWYRLGDVRHAYAAAQTHKEAS